MGFIPQTSMTKTGERKDCRAEDARRRTDAVRDIIMQAGQRLSQNDIKNLTGKLGVSRATAYQMVRTFRSCGAVTDPATRPVGHPKGTRMLDATRELLIRDAILGFYLLPASPPSFSQLVDEIKYRCQKKELPAPNWRTIKTRVYDIEIQQRARRDEAK